MLHSPISLHSAKRLYIKNGGLRDELEKPTASIEEVPQSHGFNKTRTSYTPGDAQRILPTPIIKVYVLAACAKIQPNHHAALVFIKMMVNGVVETHFTRNILFDEANRSV